MRRRSRRRAACLALGWVRERLEELDALVERVDLRLMVLEHELDDHVYGVLANEPPPHPPAPSAAWAWIFERFCRRGV